MRTLLTLAVLAFPGLAQQAPPTGSLTFRRVHVEPAEQGAPIHARGENWKIAFHDGKATLYPLGCADRDRHWPVAFELQRRTGGDQTFATTASGIRRTGERQVQIDRGTCTEIWDLAADHVEQSFRFERPLGEGDLTLAVQCATERTFARGAHGELQFSRPDGSTVVCSDAFVADAAGRKLPLELGWQHGAMVLTVPAAFLQTATWPVVVDPILRVIGVATTPTTFLRPQAAFDPGANVWVIVVEDELNATDTDVMVFRLALDGSVLDTAVIELSPDQAISPDVGSLAAHGKFLVAYRNESTNRLIRRFCDAATFTFGAVVQTVIPGFANSRLLRIGGAKVDDEALVCVTEGVLVSEVLRAFTVDANNTASPSVVLSSGPQHTAIEVTDLGVANGDWGVVTRLAASGNFYGVRPGLLGTVPVASPPLSLPVQSAPKIAGDGPFLVISTDASSPPAVIARTIVQQLSHTFSIGFTENLSTIENATSGSPITNRRELTLASDGCRFAFTFREDHQSTPTATILSTIRQVRRGLAETFVFDERRIGSGLVGNAPSLCAAGATGGPAGVYLLVAPQSGPGSALGAVRYDGRVAGDMFTLEPNGCGAPFAPLIGATGMSVFGGTYTVRLQRTVGVPLLLGGLPEPAAVPICGPNPGCLRGVQLPVPTVDAGGAITVQVPCAAGMLGVRLAFQGVDLLGPGGCPASVFGIDFRLSDTLIATVR